MTLGAVVISRNDNYGGAQTAKATFCFRSLIEAMDQVIYVDWNSPNDVSVVDVIREQLPSTGKFRHIRVTQQQHNNLVGDTPGVQKCIEVLARNIGIRRLMTDYIVSTNHDLMCLARETIEQGIINESTFHCIARRETKFPLLQEMKYMGAWQFLMEYGHTFGQHGDGSPLGPSDLWSLITCPGDFQIAHRNLWHKIKGFEESLIFRGYSDSNVQRKAEFYGFDLKLVRSIPVFHFEHYPDTGSCGGAFGAWNDRAPALEEFAGTTNSEMWGMADVDFEEEII